jgi:hypothetical protein
VKDCTLLRWSHQPVNLATIIGTLLPIVVVLLLGFFSGCHKGFNGDQATALNRMVMLYALQLDILFGSAISIPWS